MTILNGGNINGHHLPDGVVHETLYPVKGNPKINRVGATTINLSVGERLINQTPEEVVLYAPYSTVRNGKSDNISIPPNGYIKLVAKGDAHYFSSYEIGKI